MTAGADRFFELASDLLAVVGSDGTIERANEAWRRTLGHDPAALVGHPLATLVAPEDVEILARRLEAPGSPAGELQLRTLAADGSSTVLVWRLARETGSERLVVAAHAPRLDPEVEEALRLSEERHRELFESNPVAMAVWDPATGEVLAANDAALRQYDYERDEMIGLSVATLVHPEDLPRLAEAVPNLGSGIVGAAPFRHRRRDGSEIEVEVTGHPLTWGGRPARLVMAIDVTERRQLEAQLRQAQKMEAVGRLAGGIAHDFNNVLTVIGGYSRLLVDSLADDAPEREDAERIRDAADRAGSLTQQLLSFSRRGLVRASTVDLNDVVRDACRMLERVLGEHVDVRLSLRAPSPLVRSDETQLQQVVVNLALNARDAMPDGGILSIETADGSVAPWTGGLAVPSVLLSVSDTGVGMAGELRERAFEPFFTTKAPGQGTGLGLSSVYATVSQAGGRIRLLSEPGAGTTVWIALPVVVAPEHEAASSGAAALPGESGARILLVEDEVAVRALVERILRRAGYEVLAAADAARALELEAAAERIDLLLSDVVMPGMSGIELAREIRAKRPETRVLLISGYTEESVGSSGPGSLDLLGKPFTDNELLTRIRSILGD